MNKITLGVPCSACQKESLLPCTREDEAVAIAFGMALCGKDVEVFMQNSGFGLCLDVITSLLVPYDVEIPFDVYEGADQPQHRFMNEIYKKLMELVL